MPNGNKITVTFAICTDTTYNSLNVEQHYRIYLQSARGVPTEVVYFSLYESLFIVSTQHRVL